MKKRKVIFVSLAIFFLAIFSGTFYFTERFLSTRNNEISKSIEKTQGLNDRVKISLFSGEKKEKELTVKELREELGLSEDDLSEEKVKETFENQGYSLDGLSSDEIMFKKDSKDNLEKGKYYIVSKDSFFAICKCDQNGELVLENQNDVYKNYKTVDTLGENDRYRIENYELKYDSKEKAEEGLSEFLS
ncbi:hypothetical protein [Clostridium sp. BJN0001]|uniref:hypothetical protein n=1 Tax=Clostridium sp. BJN0001 TaxID=2930219 RepID=UPI001FD4F8D0|nr:hypothetical protein [Clostridium sp. BJN0001]